MIVRYLLSGVVFMLVSTGLLRAQVADLLAEFYPFAVGNVWQYTFTRYGERPDAEPWVLSPLPYTITIVGDTVMPNGMRYYHMVRQTASIFPFYTAIDTGYVRYGSDSTSDSQGLYAYDFATGKERRAESWVEHWRRIHEFNAECSSSVVTACLGRGMMFGDSVDVIGFGFANSLSGDTSARGFGVARVHFGDCEYTMAACEEHVLVYAKIDGREYGQYLSVPATDAALTTATLDAPTPNPFGASISIGFTLPRRGYVLLDVVDAAGMPVATLVDGSLDAGSHRATLDGAGLSSGLYIVRLRAGGITLSRRVVLAR